MAFAEVIAGSTDETDGFPFSTMAHFSFSAAMLGRSCRRPSGVSRKASHTQLKTGCSRWEVKSPFGTRLERSPTGSRSMIPMILPGTGTRRHHQIDSNGPIAEARHCDMSALAEGLNQAARKNAHDDAFPIRLRSPSLRRPTLWQRPTATGTARPISCSGRHRSRIGAIVSPPAPSASELALVEHADLAAAGRGDRAAGLQAAAELQVDRHPAG